MGEDLFDTLDAVDRLAAALRLRRFQLCLRLGDLTTAAALADDWAAGRVSLDDVRARIECAESEAA